jgi:hypothetical protein
MKEMATYSVKGQKGRVIAEKLLSTKLPIMGSSKKLGDYFSKSKLNRGSWSSFFGKMPPPQTVATE